MRKKIDIKIRTEQFQRDRNPTVIDSISDGEMSRTETGWEISYRESPESGLSDAVTTINVEDDGTVDMDRVGIHEMNMKFQKGKSHVSRMSTPYGVFDVGFVTDLVAFHFDENGGRVFLSYTINYSEEFPIKTVLDISVKPHGENADAKGI